MAYIEVKNESKVYQMGETKIFANRDVNFEVEEGKVTVILGPSGAGKSTVLNMLGGMDSPTSGQIMIDNMDIATFNDRQLTNYRRHDVGFVFQFYNLIPNLSTLENVELATSLVKDGQAPEEVLKAVGLQERMDNFPSQLSGGEQQRLAIARALAKNPKLLLCDEPTGALDYQTGKQVLQLLSDASRKFHKTVIIITHNSEIAQMADRVIQINDARVRAVKDNANPVPVKDIVW
ncbi:ABC transporter ATP-binding protein [Pediococcus pentosaceus]|jgi:putative ABC transport system ATP-binding protein|uniref:ABC transporter ATP-binding protein n=3 Tax=Pediococcus pentosaceus TaxID=1255 RepID=A0ABD7X6J6_PEDPE|nr:MULTISPECIES: ABC transporter ATP-binding protein [Pediococcus]ABJ68366.1 ABC-type antimicrobial peptide transport system, ATPase component [Pediococcus pentosaceus ATCC 25745]ANI97614.1 macrolide ABC transporter ATP-binding protein [Pediococcus pentosaceus]ASC08123.1 ATP-binding cassette sub-family A member 8-A [Pediococcus pentosaceus]AVL01801.1 macrolide ABC transporter ATP-binding protein [Pediococcus pentosaceus]AXR43804.1 ABC transporter ATP-binding protein [Pediococcus pentosaceus]